MRYLASKDWWEKAGTRMIKTMAQCFIAGVGTSTIMSQVDWKFVLSSSVIAGVLSLCTSLSGLPELDESAVG